MLVKFGIIGCSTIAPWHAAGIRDTDGTALTAVCDHAREKAESLAAAFGKPKVYTKPSDLLADPNVDVVCVCTPSGTHTDLGIEAARAGKHVLVEKPVGIDLQKVDRLIAECRRAGVKLGVIFQMRTSALWKRVREAVQSGALGRMVLGDAYIKYYRTQEYYDSSGWRGTWALDGGGALMNQGIHAVDLLQWIMGPVESVFAYAGHLVHRIEVEDTAVAAVRFASGALGIIEAATSAPPGMDLRLEFHGERGSIRVQGDSVVTWEVAEDKTLSATADIGASVKLGSGASEPTAISMEGHRIQIEDMATAVRENRDPMVTGEEARKAVELILAIYQSAASGTPVRLPLVA